MSTNGDRTGTNGTGARADDRESPPDRAGDRERPLSLKDALIGLLGGGVLLGVLRRPVRAATSLWEDSDGDDLLETPDHDGIDVSAVDTDRLSIGGREIYPLNHENSGDSSERVSSIPIDGTKHVIYSNYLSNLSAGDTLMVLAEAEFTNDHSYDVSLLAQLVFTSSSTATWGTEVGEANGEYLTPDIHHAVPVKVGTLEVTQQMLDNGYDRVNLVAYCNASSADSGDTLTVEQDYGRLSVIQF